MLEIIKYGEFKPIGKQKNKNKIILINTFRDAKNYLVSLKYRHNGEYDKIPNYIISKKGEIIKLMDDAGYSNFFDDKLINYNSVVIAIENLGWLEKNQTTGFNNNWIGDIYNGIPYYKKWRDYDFWDNYTNAQINSLAMLCSELCNKLGISKKFIGHNTKTEIGVKFNGILSRSNIYKTYTDISPSFDIKLFEKILENGRK
jgi:N-acetyl-anhydromuramyl-L-alanine amidase AmpD